MGHSNVWNSHPKTYGPGSRACRVCGNPHAIIRKYGLMCCRQCFRSNAKEIGFIKVTLNPSSLNLFNTAEEFMLGRTLLEYEPLKRCNRSATLSKQLGSLVLIKYT
ncbi:hypothetical protein Golax_004809 [Gossypium laxum]|uniref:40S ribosomal protein S29 n=3 Tax=Gossypium TaxID=3633 RepID=A0A7J8ZYR2_9ROSI|nr:hypothetical protein [Gossypium laxum]